MLELCRCRTRTGPRGQVLLFAFNLANSTKSRILGEKQKARPDPCLAALFKPIHVLFLKVGHSLTKSHWRFKVEKALVEDYRH